MSSDDVADPAAQPKKRVLNAGSGPYEPERLYQSFRGDDWEEVRLDIDPEVQPDLLGTVVDMRPIIPDGSFEAVWSSHNMEHLHNHEVGLALREFVRILKPNGFCLITCPDIQHIAGFVAAGNLEKTVYTSPAGPITPLDMIFGHSASIGRGNVHMAHNTSFTADRMGRLAIENGFHEVRVGKGIMYDLWALMLMPEADMLDLARMLADTEQAGLVADILATQGADTTGAELAGNVVVENDESVAAETGVEGTVGAGEHDGNTAAPPSGDIVAERDGSTAVETETEAPKGAAGGTPAAAGVSVDAVESMPSVKAATAVSEQPI